MAEGYVYHEILSTEKLTLDSTIATGDVYIQRIGNLRIISGTVSMINTGAFQTLCNLSGDKPPVEINAPCSSYNNSIPSEIKLTTITGSLQISVPSGGNANSIKFNFSYSVV